MDREFLKRLLDTVTVSGNEEAGQALALACARDFADAQTVDAVGNAISIVHPDAPCRVLLCGHMDEIGFRVTHIGDDGLDRKSTRLNSSHTDSSRMPSSA